MKSHAAAGKPGTQTGRVHPEVAPAPEVFPAPGGNGNGRPATGADRLTVRLGTDRDRETIYRLRHEVYARELGQYSTNTAGRLTDALDAFNHYLVISDGDRIVGFVSITPPGGRSYSIDKYFKREELPFPVNDRLYEIRLLTVPQDARRSLLALALMYAAFRWVEARGGTRIMAIGRAEIRSMHLRVGLETHRTGRPIRRGHLRPHPGYHGRRPRGPGRHPEAPRPHPGHHVLGNRRRV